MLFGVYTKFNIVCTICQHKKFTENVCIDKIRCSMRLTRKACITLEVNEMGIKWFCDVTGDIRLYSVSDFMHCFSSFNMASGGDDNFPEY